MSSEDKREKKKKQSKGVSFITYILSLFVVLIFGVLITLFFTSRQTYNLVPSTQVQDSEESLSLGTVSELYQVLTQEYYGDVDSDELISGALEGMADAVDDPHTEFLDAVESSEINQEISGSFEGIGAEVVKEEDKLRVVSPIPESPADQAGILPNDYILAVDGESVADLNVQEAVALIRGPKGSEVELDIEREGNQFSLTIERDSIPIETVVYEQLEDQPSIGRIQITRFNQPTYDELVEAIQSLEEDGVTQFIFDLRGNPGGLLDSAVMIGNIFVPNGDPIMQVQESEDEDPIIFTADEEYGEFKFDEDHEAVVLINEGSASASEILAGAMQESGYTVIGQPSYGKGTVQSLYPLTGGSEIKFTNHIWLTAAGEWVNEKGIQPDVSVEQLGQGSLLLIDPEQSYQVGDQSEEVANINALLDLLGYDASESDQFTDQTEAAVMSLQADHEIEQTGIVTETTAIRLMQDVRDYIAENDKQIERAISELESEE